MHYDTTVLYCVFSSFLFLFFSPYPRKLNDNEKLWIYVRYIIVCGSILSNNLPILKFWKLKRLDREPIHEII